ncbi:arylesterase [Aliifodinibius sp. S!AR15-10]|uniref:arylesterase n=1 Tax=Aliifodinibius sp. S!AR15-10 TaxID=2950437 RepID=UPI0028649376|nr:arylesterase [Aliifodinibius sp. S!AR15-10]MDR8390534.1 arylesterase [Aliifodinibius sp. S!AR15-10]
MKRFIFLVSALLLLAYMPCQSQNDVSRILFFGDSITAGNGVNKDEAFPALIQEKVDSLGWDFNVQNGGLSGETSAGGLRRIDWMLQQPVDVFVLELGGNDGLRGIEVKATKENLQKIIERVQSKYPDARIILAGMQVPPNLGQQYTRDFKQMYADLAEKYNLPFIPFILEGAALDPDLMQNDDIHPNAKGHEIVAENVWEVLKPVLQNMRS